MRTQKHVVALVACLCGVLGLAAAAGGAKKLKTVSVTVPVPGDAVVTATPGCGDDAKAVSGGFAIDNDDGLIFILENLRLGNRRWTDEVRNNTTTTPGTLTGYAYCRDQKLESFTETTTLAPSDADNVFARCPAGTKAVSGGFDASSGDETVLVHISRKVGKREWEVAGQNFSPDSSAPLTAQVNCHEGKKLKTKQASETVSDFDEEDVVAKCKRKQRVVSGGFAADSPVSKGGPFFTASHKQGRRKWNVSLETFANQITAYAYCEKKKPKKN